MRSSPSYDVVIVGGGHNGLVASCYLAMAGLRVLILEKNDHLGGATYSHQIFPGVDVRVSVYSYLVSLLPDKILTDLGIEFKIRQRSMASYTPVRRDGQSHGLLISNSSEEITRASFIRWFGSDREYGDYRYLEAKLRIFAQKVWPTLLSPLLSRQEMRARFHGRSEGEIWDYLVERPLSSFIEDHLSDDIVRGIVFTDAKIGVLTHPDDASLIQNKTFLYHIIGQGTGEWRVPVGGMGALVDALKRKAQELGVSFETLAEVTSVDHSASESSVHYVQQEKIRSVFARYILFNTSSNVINQCLPDAYHEARIPGSVFKINMVLRRLPKIKGGLISSEDAFTGTFHLNEGYEHMKASYRSAAEGSLMDRLPGEMYCHSLTDPTILSPALQEQGYQTLTLFGLDVPYHLFRKENDAVKAGVTKDYLSSINTFIGEDISTCLAVDRNENPCIDTKSPLDLEEGLALPEGNIFHGNLTWPFAELDEDAGTWGVETNYPNVFVCGSSAIRGGAVSGIPGHNAAMKVLEEVRKANFKEVR